MAATNSRKFKGFAVIERPDGALIWGTFRPTEAEARKAFDRWNPPVAGFSSPAEIVAVTIRLDK